MSTGYNMPAGASPADYEAFAGLDGIQREPAPQTVYTPEEHAKNRAIVERICRALECDAYRCRAMRHPLSESRCCAKCELELCEMTLADDRETLAEAEAHGTPYWIFCRPSRASCRCRTGRGEVEADCRRDE